MFSIKSEPSQQHSAETTAAIVAASRFSCGHGDRWSLAFRALTSIQQGSKAANYELSGCAELMSSCPG